MNERLRVGILGTGSMAVVMATSIKAMKNVEAAAVASRTLSKAQAFAERFGIPKAYGTYEEMYEDDDLDLIYVVSPHSHHAQYAGQCIDHGRAVLVEKSFTVNAEQARALIKKAEEKGVFLTEAIWTRYMPMTKTIAEAAHSGKIGRINAITANLGYAVSDRERVISPELAGGALLDVGVYALTFISTVLGDDISDVKAVAALSERGVDLSDQVSFNVNFEGRKIPCSFYTSITGPTDRNGIIYGTEGYMIVGNVNNYQYIEIYDNSHRLVEEIAAPSQKETGYVYQFEACRRALSEGKKECEEMTHRMTIDVMENMDVIRRVMGVTYPADMAE